MNLPNKEQFGVSRIKKQKNGGLFIDYAAIFPGENDTFNTDSDKKTSDRPPHEDFVKLINSVKPHVAKIFNYADVNNVATTKEFEINKKGSKFITNLYQEYIDRITINGIQLWATGMLITACQINFSLRGHNSQSMNLKTYKIDLKGDINVHGFEDELRVICTELVDESFEYIYNNKGGQLEAFEK